METNSPEQSALPIARQQYTTVGSVWHPQLQPIQPPTRRGRTLRAVVPDSYEYNSPNSPNSSPYGAHYYSPLRQNVDRAISPPTPDQLVLARIADIERAINSDDFAATSALTSAITSAIMPLAPAIPTTPYAPQNHDDTNAYRDDGNDDDDDDDDVMDNDEINEALNQMPTKTLTNLASYPNPMKKQAQKILSRARQLPPMPHQSSDLTQENRVAARPPTLGAGRNARSDPVGMENLLQSGGIDDHGLHHQPFGTPKPNTGAYSRESDTYPAVLSKGPGAPLPLTAGPPGQRQFQPSAFTQPANNAQQRSFENPRGFDFIDDNARRLRTHSSFESQQTVRPPQEPSLAHPSENASLAQKSAWSVFQTSSLGKARARENSGGVRVTDTLTYEQALKFFPNGVPADFDRNTKSIPDNWVDLRLQEIAAEERKKREQTITQQSLTAQASHRAKLYNDFYAGRNMTNNDVQTVHHELYSRDDSPNGSASSEKAKQSKENIAGRYISVEEANKIPTPEHAEPLLSMLVQSLARHSGSLPEAGGPKKTNGSR